MRIPLLVALAVSIDCASAAFPEPKPLSGTFAVYGTTLVDPPAKEVQNSHFYFYLDGEAAKALWGTMKTKETRNLCLDDGSTIKRIGEMQCTADSAHTVFACAFGIDVQAQKITNGQAC